MSNHFGSAPVSGHVRIQAGVRGTMIVFNSFAQSRSVADAGGSTVRWMNVLANDAIEAMMPSAPHVNLGDLSTGSVLYCSDCAATAPCTGRGAGALAKRLPDGWSCR
jgi:hypothetical protein